MLSQEQICLQYDYPSNVALRPEDSSVLIAYVRRNSGIRQSLYVNWPYVLLEDVPANAITGTPGPFVQNTLSRRWRLFNILLCLTPDNITFRLQREKVLKTIS